MYKYSQSENSFYNTYVHLNEFPKDSVDIDEDLYLSLMHEKSKGKDITTGPNGLPIAIKIDAGLSKVAACSPAQGLVALFALKQITEDDVQSAVNGIADEISRYTYQIAFRRAILWERNSQTMQAMASLLGLSESDLDELFEYAVTIQA